MGITDNILIIFFLILNKKQQPKKPGCVIILNGISSSGKSTIQHLITNFRKKEFWLLFGFDHGVVKTVPEYSNNSCYSYKKSNYFRKNIFCDDIEGPCILLKYGHFGNQVIEGLHRAIKEYAKRGLNIAVDYLAYAS